MNFDTRTVIDIINLNNDFKESLFELILEEQSMIDSTDEFRDKIFIETVTPIVKNKIKDFLFRKELTKMNLGILKGIINLNNVDYKYLIEDVTSF
jgi:hypothetical protein